MATATMTFPIRELSANVQYEAASAQKAFWGVVDSKEQQARFHWMMWFMTRKLDKRLGQLVGAQRSLVDHLHQIPSGSMTSADFTRIADDLYRIVSMTDSLLEDSYEMPERCLNVWRSNLEQIADLSSHLDSFAESFRMASDAACTALLANLVVKIEARQAF